MADPVGVAEALGEKALASGWVPDRVLRGIIRSRVKGLVRGLERLTPQEQAARERALLESFETGPVTINADDANNQHYELPPAFFEMVLGPRLKYSSCYWPAGAGGLAEAEEAMLALTAERAGLADGQEILDLGCGWGSFSLWAAERFPGSRILAVSNSSEQRRFIEARCRALGLRNLEVVTAEIGTFEPGRRFDCVVSVEMLEHVRNHRELMRRLGGWLDPEGRVFIHVFCHRRHFYAFERGGIGGWMARHFFSGGMMPSWDHLLRYQEHLQLVGRWEVDGRHYARTLRAWLDNLDAKRESVSSVMEATYGPHQAWLWLARWRVFFMACEETFALGSGTEYFVAHYLFAPRTGDSPPPAGQATR